MKISMLPDMDGIARGVPKAEKEPSPAQKSVARAHDAKVSATDSWVRGEIDSKKHAEIHKRADKVIACKGKM